MPKIGTYFSQQTAERYLADCGIAENLIPGLLASSGYERTIKGVQGFLTVYEAMSVRMISLRELGSSKGIDDYLTADQKKKAGRKPRPKSKPNKGVWGF